MNIRTDLVVRVCIITAVISILSYFLVMRNEYPAVAIPALFVLFGIVILISILFDLNRFHVPLSEYKTNQ
jgi:hypothetical protein